MNETEKLIYTLDQLDGIIADSILDLTAQRGKIADALNDAADKMKIYLETCDLLYDLSKRLDETYDDFA